jgi:hypothetical protein
LNQEEFLGHTDYNALQSSLTRRFSNGIMFGASYTWSHSLGTTTYDPLVASNDERNYGPTTADRRQILAINYAIDLPKLGKHLHNKMVAAVTDNWMLSGITMISTGAPFSPTCTSSAGTDITGSTNETARCFVTGDSKLPGPAGALFNTAAFQLAPVGTIGNLGVNALTGPGYWNFDATMQKFIPIWGEARGIKLQFQGYNILNHTEFTAYNAAATFSTTGAQTNSAFGTPSTDRQARILAFAIRFEF